MKFFQVLALALMCPFALVSCGGDDGPDGGDAPVIKPIGKGVEFADPFIMLDGDVYYAYGTGDTGVDVYTSDDLKMWKPAGRALDRSNSYGNQWFWAPEVYRIGDRYLMYYTAEEHTCVAEATSPLGPFKQAEHKPLFENEKTIDNTLFIDDDGTPYMLYCRLNDGNNINVVPLSDDLLSVKEGAKPTFCFRQSQPWEVEPVNEGSFVIKHGDTYYLTYSGNGYTNPGYGVGYATSKSPLGPWTKYEGNPVFQYPRNKDVGALEGVGHSALFRDKEGRLRIVFHAHYRKGVVHPREMYVSTVTFSDGENPVMMVSQEDMMKCYIK